MGKRRRSLFSVSLDRRRRKDKFSQIRHLSNSTAVIISTTTLCTMEIGPRNSAIVFPDFLYISSTYLSPMLPRIERLRDTKPVILVPTPGDKCKIIFGIYLSGPWITAQDFLSIPRDRQLVIHDCVRLKTKLAWLTSYVDEFRVHIELPVIKHFLSEIRAPIRSTTADVGGFVHLFQTVDVTVPYVTDVQLGGEHFFVSETRAKNKWVQIITNPTKPPSAAGS
jgi:hypothetical protein